VYRRYLGKLSISSAILTLGLSTAFYIDAVGLSLDPFWRYQGIIITKWLLDGANSEPIAQSTTQSLVWVNDFTRDFGGPMIVAVLSQVLGYKPEMIHNMPTFYPFLLFSQIFAASQVLSDKIKLGAVAVLSFAFQYRLLHILTTSHRVMLGFVLFFFLIGIVLSQTKLLPRTVLLVVFSAAFTTSYSTLVLSSAVLFFAIFIFGYIMNKQRFRYSVAAIVLLIPISRYSIANKWLMEAFQNLFIYTVAAIKGNSYSLFQSGWQSSVTRQYDLNEFLYDPAVHDPVISTGLTFTRVGAGSIILLLAVSRTYYNISTRFGQVESRDLLIFAVALQAMWGIVLTPLFAANAGTNPFTLFTLIAPIFLVLFYEEIQRHFTNRPNWDTKKWKHLTVAVLILLAAPGILTTVTEPSDPIREAMDVEDGEVAASEWLVDNSGSMMVTSDFNQQSLYFSLGGRNHIYQPRFAENSVEDAIKDTYYNSPTISPRPGYWLVTSQLEHQAMFFRVGILTRPNPSLTSNIESSSQWNKIYDNNHANISLSNVAT